MDSMKNVYLASEQLWSGAANSTGHRKPGLHYWLFGIWDDISDPRNQHLPLVGGGPWGILIVIALYLAFTIRLGPNFMKHREPYKLRLTLILYNFLMVLFNIHFFIESLIVLDWGRKCLEFDFPSYDDNSVETKRMIMAGYKYYWSKILDLTDTIFFVLRKKNNQVSLLHLYHHSVMPILTWIAISISPTSGPAGIFPLINSVVHIIMYAYYGLAAIGPQMQKYLWWKKYITILQMAQFAFLFFFACVFLKFQTGYPSLYFYIFAFPQPIVFFFMFYSFYRQSYVCMHNINAKHD